MKTFTEVSLIHMRPGTAKVQKPTNGNSKAKRNSFRKFCGEIEQSPEASRLYKAIAKDRQYLLSI